MSNPNSPITRIRRYLSIKLEPRPDPGEAWCVNCSLEGGRKTIIISVDGMREHVKKHQAFEGDKSYCRLMGDWPIEKG